MWILGLKGLSVVGCHFMKKNHLFHVITATLLWLKENLINAILFLSKSSVYLIASLLDTGHLKDCGSVDPHDSQISASLASSEHFLHKTENFGYY